MAIELTDVQTILDILGITDRELITKVILTIEPDSIPTVEITKMLKISERYEDATQMFELVKVEDTIEAQYFTYTFECNMEEGMLFEQELKRYGIHGLSIEQHNPDPLSRTPYRIVVDRLTKTQLEFIDDTAKFVKARYR